MIGTRCRERPRLRTPLPPAVCAGCQLPYVSTTCLRFRGQDAYALSQPCGLPQPVKDSVALQASDCKPGKESTLRKVAMRFLCIHFLQYPQISTTALFLQ